MTYSNECLNVVGQVRVNEDTFTGEEVEEIVEAVEEAAASEVESELLNSAHTNILLLKQLFSQAEKWHLNLDTDMSELENRDLLDAVKQWEERELMGGKVTSVQCCSVRCEMVPCVQMEKPLMDKKRLAPLNEGGPAHLLQLQIQKLEQENTALKLRIKTVRLDI